MPKQKKSTAKKFTPEIKEQIKIKFIQGIEDNAGGRKLFSLDHLCLDYGVAKSTVYRHSQKENWKQAQIDFQNEFIKELNIRRQKEMADESVNFDKTSLQIAKAIMGQIGMVIRKNQETGEVIPHHLTALSTAATNAQKIAKLALGEATENMNLNADIKDTATFRDALRQLDEVAEQVRKANTSSIH